MQQRVGVSGVEWFCPAAVRTGGGRPRGGAIGHRMGVRCHRNPELPRNAWLHFGAVVDSPPQAHHLCFTHDAVE